MRWITVGPADQPDTSIVLYPPFADPGITDDERRTIVEMMAKGTYGIIVLSTSDLDATFEKLQASDAEIVQEPTDQPYGIRDCAIRDPAGNLIRINQRRWSTTVEIWAEIGMDDPAWATGVRRDRARDTITRVGGPAMPGDRRPPGAALEG